MQARMAIAAKIALMNSTLTALKGVQVGHASHPEQLTGCTVILFDKDFPVAYKAYGGVPGTYNTENLRNGMSYANRNALFIAGGSVNGLTVSTRIIEKMIAMKCGLQVGETIIPSISGAVVWDLSVGQGRFDPAYGAEAVAQCSYNTVTSGNVGAGTGTSVGKFSYTKEGLFLNMKAGVGSARVDVGGGVIVCALSVVNAMGNIIRPDGSILAGNRNDKTKPKFRPFHDMANSFNSKRSNTTITIIGTNADLGSRENYERVAHFATQGQVRAIEPVHTSLDGDIVFVFSNQEVKNFSPLAKKDNLQGWPEASVDLVGWAAAEATRLSVYEACTAAETITCEQAFGGVIPGHKDY